MTTSELLPTPQARDWKGAGGPNRRSRSIADVLTCLPLLRLVKQLPKLDKDEAKRMTIGSGRKLLPLYKQSSRHGASLRTSTAYLLLNQAWYSRNCALRWKASVTTSNRLLFRLLPSTRRIGGTGSGLLRTPLVHESGTAIDQLVTKDGHPYCIGKTAYNRLTGQYVRVGLQQQLGSVTGGKLQLQPAFVMWMMGLPADWCDFPMETSLAKADGEERR